MFLTPVIILVYLCIHKLFETDFLVSLFNFFFMLLDQKKTWCCICIAILIVSRTSSQKRLSFERGSDKLALKVFNCFIWFKSCTLQKKQTFAAFLKMQNWSKNTSKFGFFIIIIKFCQKKCFSARSDIYENFSIMNSNIHKDIKTASSKM